MDGNACLLCCCVPASVRRLWACLAWCAARCGNCVAALLARARFPQVKIVLRADSGFGCDATLRFCDQVKIGYVLGLCKNRRLQTL